MDIYFDYEYCKINEIIEDGKAVPYVFKSENGTIKYNFIQKKIPENDGLYEKIYYDITTPYGYGGPLIVDASNKEELIKEFEAEFSNYCKKNNIVSEFIRFHPILKNHNDFETLYDLEYSRDTVGTNLLDYENPFKEEFSKSCRKKINKQLRDGLNYEIIENPNDIQEFLKFYYSTMDRNMANNFYYFSEEYFQKFVQKFNENIVLVKAIHEDKTIAMGFYFIYNKYIHIHLSGTLKEYLHLSPAYILRFGITEWGKKKGFEMIHHGGGRTSDPEDGLFKFKKQFGKNTGFEYYLGKRIRNQKVYDTLSAGIKNSDNKFPVYRSR
ncbi:GNAT family N-acetyltransferase [Salinicoccus roseus]|uniref:GNAT family N-acetyltransferase n=1 Tax=Salinicoccus roseus TaxID=45670 RepID=UPI001EF4948E|nr:GNAT family N-acetyltransferase [Salinicoccus roseus]MCG7333056.1 GNAT family N-acetyltransferase [Salinicoccus roseus]